MSRVVQEDAGPAVVDARRGASAPSPSPASAVAAADGSTASVRPVPSEVEAPVSVRAAPRGKDDRSERQKLDNTELGHGHRTDLAVQPNPREEIAPGPSGGRS